MAKSRKFPIFFYMLDTDYERVSIACFFQPCLSTTPSNAMCCFDCACSSSCIGKGCRVIKWCIECSCTTIIHYNAKLYSARGVCALESSSSHTCMYIHVGKSTHYSQNQYSNSEISMGGKGGSKSTKRFEAIISLINRLRVSTEQLHTYQGKLTEQLLWHGNS